MNECDKGIAECNQQCNNTNGSYFCTCFEGYDLDENNYTCFGM